MTIRIKTFQIIKEDRILRTTPQISQYNVMAVVAVNER